MSQEKPTLGYWAIRGLAQPIRLLLHYVGQEFIDLQYTTGPAPDYSRQAWYDIKATLTDIPFVNLPYYIDGDIKMSQSSAILRYIGRKYNLLGDNDQECLRVDMVDSQNLEFRYGYWMLCYNPDFEKLLPDYLKNLPAKLKAFEDYLGGNPWFVGEKITIADFPMYDALDQHRILSPGCLDAYPRLCAFMDRFEALSAIKKYMESSEYIKLPLNNPNAHYN